MGWFVNGKSTGENVYPRVSGMRASKVNDDVTAGNAATKLELSKGRRDSLVIAMIARPPAQHGGAPNPPTAINLL